ncbi:hypothetical protein [Sphingomonas psychrotolerans]|uniref:hypothetical protein n=1 Tax=Sphingomonas psychrotolerans TaxID=1327635 RepID=UPI001F2E9B45|nr:hypothetical protein [Sphingomonas psychrotolerans]
MTDFGRFVVIHGERLGRADWSGSFSQMDNESGRHARRGFALLDAQFAILCAAFCD